MLARFIHKRNPKTDCSKLGTLGLSQNLLKELIRQRLDRGMAALPGPPSSPSEE